MGFARLILLKTTLLHYSVGVKISWPGVIEMEKLICRKTAARIEELRFRWHVTMAIG
jgi:hypothetical protein